jgi:hypothetical protein
VRCTCGIVHNRLDDRTEYLPADAACATHIGWTFVA